MSNFIIFVLVPLIIILIIFFGDKYFSKKDQDKEDERIDKLWIDVHKTEIERSFERIEENIKKIKDKPVSKYKKI